MKKFLSLLCLSFLAVAFVSCTNNPAEGADDPNNPNAPIIQGGGGVIKFALEADGPWEILGLKDSKNIIITPSSGDKGKIDIVVQVKKVDNATQETINFGAYGTLEVSFGSILNITALGISIRDASEYFTVNGFVNSQVCSATVFVKRDLKNPLTRIDLNKYPNLTNFSILKPFGSGSGGTNTLGRVKSINLSGTKIASIRLSESEYTSELESINITNCTQLNNLMLVQKRYYSHINECPLKEIDLMGVENLKEIEIEGTSITSIDLTTQTQLKSVELWNNKLTSIDLSKNKLIEKLNCYNNQITKLNFGQTPLLKDVACAKNNLSSLTIDSEVLSELSCENNPNLNEVFLTAKGSVKIRKDSQTTIKYK